MLACFQLCSWWFCQTNNKCLHETRLESEQRLVLSKGQGFVYPKEDRKRVLSKCAVLNEHIKMKKTERVNKKIKGANFAFTSKKND